MSLKDTFERLFVGWAVIGFGSMVITIVGVVALMTVGLLFYFLNGYVPALVDGPILYLWLGFTGFYLVAIITIVSHIFRGD
jgi:hypothetical protein